MEYIVGVSCIGESGREQKHLLGIQIFNFVEKNEEYLSQSCMKVEAELLESRSWYWQENKWLRASFICELSL